ncbi:hypothetical protein, partial [Bacillus sp. 196mf]|uniref:hypothetical protein n=1 Tax=Bacillus sp. 196mf TaxID=1761754 RepID=UPI000D9E8B2A
KESKEKESKEKESKEEKIKEQIKELDKDIKQNENTLKELKENRDTIEDADTKIDAWQKDVDAAKEKRDNLVEQLKEISGGKEEEKEKQKEKDVEDVKFEIRKRQEGEWKDIDKKLSGTDKGARNKKVTELIKKVKNGEIKLKQAMEELNEIQLAMADKRTGIYDKLERIIDKIGVEKLNRDKVVSDTLIKLRKEADNINLFERTKLENFASEKLQNLYTLIHSDIPNETKVLLIKNVEDPKYVEQLMNILEKSTPGTLLELEDAVIRKDTGDVLGIVAALEKQNTLQEEDKKKLNDMKEKVADDKLDWEKNKEILDGILENLGDMMVKYERKLSEEGDLSENQKNIIRKLEKVDGKSEIDREKEDVLGISEKYGREIINVNRHAVNSLKQDLLKLRGEETDQDKKENLDEDIKKLYEVEENLIVLDILNLHKLGQIWKLQAAFEKEDKEQCKEIMEHISKYGSLFEESKDTLEVFQKDIDVPGFDFKKAAEKMKEFIK